MISAKEKNEADGCKGCNFRQSCQMKVTSSIALEVAQLYISRKKGERGLRSVEAEYKSTKIKAAVKLFENSDTTMSAPAVRRQCRPGFTQ